MMTIYRKEIDKTNADVFNIENKIKETRILCKLFSLYHISIYKKYYVLNDIKFTQI